MQKSKTGWRKITVHMRIAVLCAVMVVCGAAVFIAMAETGTESAETDLINSLALEQFFGLEETADGRWPEWWIEAYYTTGEWQTNPPPLAFHVPAWQEEDTGVLGIEVAPGALNGENLILSLTYYYSPESSLFICLDSGSATGLSADDPSGAAPEEPDVFWDLFGNIIQEGQNELVCEYFEIPVNELADVERVHVEIIRGAGEITILGAALYTATEFYFWWDQALAQEKDGLETQEEAGEQDESAEGDSTFSGTEGSGDEDDDDEDNEDEDDKFIGYLLSSSVIDAGGVRSSSANFVLRNSIGQPFAGFSSSAQFRLFSGFKQPQKKL